MYISQNFCCHIHLFWPINEYVVIYSTFLGYVYENMAFGVMQWKIKMCTTLAIIMILICNSKCNMLHNSLFGLFMIINTGKLYY